MPVAVRTAPPGRGPRVLTAARTNAIPTRANPESRVRRRRAPTPPTGAETGRAWCPLSLRESADAAVPTTTIRVGPAAMIAPGTPLPRAISSSGAVRPASRRARSRRVSVDRPSERRMRNMATEASSRAEIRSSGPGRCTWPGTGCRRRTRFATPKASAAAARTATRTATRTAATMSAGMRSTGMESPSAAPAAPAPWGAMLAPTPDATGHRPRRMDPAWRRRAGGIRGRSEPQGRSGS